MKKAFKVVLAEDDSDDSEDEEDMADDRTFPLGSRQRLSCFAHSLQLVVGDGLKEVKCLSQAISKVSKIATLLHSSTIFKDKFETIFDSLIAEAEKVDLEDIHVGEGSTAEPTQDSPPHSKIPRLLAKYKTHKKKHSTPTEASIATQVMKYFEDIQGSPTEEDPLKFWFHNKDKYPHLHVLALKVLSVPASSAPVERVFSVVVLVDFL
ncbi:hypothetical protein IRJ41_008551 [Triplophysa rosa]|uniref:HAT C-terminal dimerisation domain-containing protein n=1 Tax=Triplophysa rosa TaxID=992332 RepID=A0A9W8C949_TRIRA|nr:hypothetical protein IRJ41_008551 [Triplophysa rosa]